MRHGEVHNPQQLYYGRLPRFGLTTRGRAQARAAAQALADQRIGALYTSPLLRARQTAAILRDGIGGAGVRHSVLLTEVASPFDGCPAQELTVRHWDLYSDSPPGFEQPADVLQRARRFLDRARRRHAGCQVIAVTHGDLIALTILWARSALIAPQAIGEFGHCGGSFPYPQPGSITEFCFATPHPEELPEVGYPIAPEP